MTSDRRPVWLTREQAERALLLYDWELAPSDARETVEAALESGEMNCDVIAATHVVLHALGKPA